MCNCIRTTIPLGPAGRRPARAYDDDDDDDDDLYIIGAVCLSVCVSQKSLFCIQRIWSFHTFIATFRTQRIWSFPCFLTHLYSKELVISMFLDALHIQRICLFLMFIDTFRNQKCLETVKRQNSLKYSKNLVKYPVFINSLL